MNAHALAHAPTPVPAGPREASDAAAALAAPRAGIESAFLGIGEKLGRCVSILGRLSQVFQALPADFQSRELDEAGTRLEAIGVQARSMTASFAQERKVMANLLAALRAAASPIDDLMRTVKTIGIVAINARVVAAGVVDEGSGLEVFTTDIAELTGEASAAVGTLSTVYRSLVEDVRRAETQRAQFEAAHAGTLIGLGAHINARLDKVTARRREAAAQSARTGETSAKIAGGVAEVVSALQVGDNTRQRVEHVESALSMLSELPGAEEGEASLALRPHLLDTAYRLQDAQLATTVKAFTHETAGAERALRELAADVNGMVAQSRRMVGEKVKGEEAPLAALNGELRFVVEMLRNCEAARKKLDAVGAEVCAAVGSLRDHVASLQGIEANMRLLSLNATVKCAQLGARGRALNVIAQQLRELTAETEVSAETAIGSLARSADVARAFADAAVGEGATQVARLEEEASRAMGLLEGVDRRLNAAVSVLAEAAPRVTGMLEDAAATFTGQSRIADALNEARVHIASLCLPGSGPGGGGEMLGEAERAEAAALFARLRKLYTMESERLLHDGIVGRFLPAEPAAARAFN